MDFNDYQPIYIQIMNEIKANIVKGELKPGAKLLPVREVALHFKVNPNTVQRSYQELEREGVTVTKRGVGSFVAEDEELIVKMRKEMAKELTRSFLQNMKNLGFGKSEVMEIVDMEEV